MPRAVFYHNKWKVPARQAFRLLRAGPCAGMDSGMKAWLKAFISNDFTSMLIVSKMPKKLFLTGLYFFQGLDIMATL